MSTWKEILSNRIVAFERNIDRLESKLRRHSDDPLEIKTYISYGYKNKLLLRARVLEYKAAEQAEKTDSSFKNFKRNLGFFASSEIANAKIKASYGEFEKIIIANEEGFVEEILDWDIGGSGLVEYIDLVLLEPDPSKQIKPSFKAPIVVATKPKFGIISDIDDTIIKSDVKNLFKLAKNTLLGNAQSKEVFAGAAKLYQALVAQENPIFYVSSSPWNIYDTILQVFEINDLPFGPLILRDWGISQDEILPIHNKKYKIAEISRVLDIDYDLKFILIGDSGQEDPEIYSEIVAAYPERILAVYIRDVSGQKRDAEIKLLADKLKEHDIDLVLAESTDLFFEHASEQGFIAKLLKL